jgi:hypothetical protein
MVDPGQHPPVHGMVARITFFGNLYASRSSWILLDAMFGYLGLEGDVCQGDIEPVVRAGLMLIARQT